MRRVRRLTVGCRPWLLRLLTAHPEGHEIAIAAEVLGHELAHVIRTLQDRCYVAFAQEQGRLEAELAARSHGVGKVVIDGENELRIRRLDFLPRQVEAPANAVEIEVWRELATSCGPYSILTYVRRRSLAQRGA